MMKSHVIIDQIIFEMDYTTGCWRKLRRRIRLVDRKNRTDDSSNPVASSSRQPTSTPPSLSPNASEIDPPSMRTLTNNPLSTGQGRLGRADANASPIRFTLTRPAQSITSPRTIPVRRINLSREQPGFNNTINDPRLPQQTVDALSVPRTTTSLASDSTMEPIPPNEQGGNGLTLFHVEPGTTANLPPRDPPPSVPSEMTLQDRDQQQEALERLEREQRQQRQQQSSVNAWTAARTSRPFSATRPANGLLSAARDRLRSGLLSSLVPPLEQTTEGIDTGDSGTCLGQPSSAGAWNRASIHDGCGR
jgi:hypothetical protein